MAPRRAAANIPSDSESPPPQSSKKRGRASAASKKKTKNARAASDEGGEDEEEDADEGGDDEGGTQKSKGKGKKKAGPSQVPALSKEEMEEKAYALGRYALLNEYNRRPLRRDEATKLAIGPGQNRKFPAVLALASEKLAATFGMELVEMRPKGQNAGAVAAEEQSKKREEKKGRKSGADEDQATKKKGAAGPKAYILRSSIHPDFLRLASLAVAEEIPEGEDDDEAEYDWAAEDDAPMDWKRGDEMGQLGVLGVVLGLILGNGRVIEDQIIRSYLRRLDVTAGWTPPKTPASHHPSPTLDALLMTFQRQGYLEKEKSNAAAAAGNTQASQRRQSQANGRGGGGDEGDAGSEWRWGARAEIEIGELAIAEFMAEIYLGAEEDDGGARQTQQRRRGAEGRDPKTSIVTDIQRAAGSDLQDANALHGAMA